MDTREADQRTVAPKAPNGTAEPKQPVAAGPATPAGRAPATTDDTDTQKLGGPPKRVIFGVLGVVVLVAALWFGIPWLSYMLAHQGTDDARVDADAVAVTSRINEKINQILVDTNQEVKHGQLLIVLDNKDEIARLKQAQAQYDLAIANQRTTTLQGRGGVAQAQGELVTNQAQVPVAQAGVSQASAQLQVSDAQLPAAQAAFDKAQADFARTQSLVASGDEPSQNMDTARAAYAQASAQFRGARDQISVAQANLSAAQERVNASNATIGAAQGGVTTAQGKLAQAADPSQVESAKAQLDLAKQNLTYTRVYAAIDGYVGEKNAEVGQTVAAGSTLMTLIPHRIYITANFKETQMGSMRVGQPVDIKVDAYGGQTFHGHVISINPASQNTYALVPAQNATGNFVKVTQRIPVRISIDDQSTDHPLRPGMSVETFVKTK
ncbi:MAG TPA: HlyD family secretion protein [Candidatus Tumulicola sp.]|jgi:membrane fusion protein (multidrug efflux system)